MNLYEEDIKNLTKLNYEHLTVQDGQRIWKHFQRFAEYDDLKDLYHRFMPQIIKFENQVADYET